MISVIFDSDISHSLLGGTSEQEWMNGYSTLFSPLTESPDTDADSVDSVDSVDWILYSIR